MPWAHERRKRLSLWCHQGLLEGDAFIARQHGLAEANQPIAIAHRRWYVSDLVTSRLALPDGAPETPKGLEEEGLHIMGLKPARLGTFHLLTNTVNARCVHRIMRKCPILKKRPQGFLIEGLLDDPGQPCSHVRLIAVADRVDQQLAQRPSFELHLAEHVEHLPAERAARLVELLQQLVIYI